MRFLHGTNRRCFKIIGTAGCTLRSQICSNLLPAKHNLRPYTDSAKAQALATQRVVMKISGRSLGDQLGRLSDLLLPLLEQIRHVVVLLAHDLAGRLRATSRSHSSNPQSSPQAFLHSGRHAPHKLSAEKLSKRTHSVQINARGSNMTCHSNETSRER